MSGTPLLDEMEELSELFGGFFSWKWRGSNSRQEEKTSGVVPLVLDTAGAVWVLRAPEACAV